MHEYLQHGSDPWHKHNVVAETARWAYEGDRTGIHGKVRPQESRHSSNASGALRKPTSLDNEQCSSDFLAPLAIRYPSLMFL